jgi:hypothetical protein
VVGGCGDAARAGGTQRQGMTVGRTLSLCATLRALALSDTKKKWRGNNHLDAYMSCDSSDFLLWAQFFLCEHLSMHILDLVINSSKRYYAGVKIMKLIPVNYGRIHSHEG